MDPDSPEHLGCRAVYARIKYLPPEAALWRAQHEDGITGTDDSTERTHTSKDEDVTAYLRERIGESPSRPGGIVVQAE